MRARTTASPATLDLDIVIDPDRRALARLIADLADRGQFNAIRWIKALGLTATWERMTRG
jgi:hypothetical protein